MKHVCPDCGYESTDPGTCPTCEVDLLKREDELNPGSDEDDSGDLDNLDGPEAEDDEEDW